MAIFSAIKQGYFRKMRSFSTSLIIYYEDFEGLNKSLCVANFRTRRCHWKQWRFRGTAKKL